MNKMENEITPKQEQAYIKAISKIFTLIPIKNRLKTEEKSLRVMDEPNIALISSKSEEGRYIVNMFCDQNQPMPSEPTLSYEKLGSQAYSTEYLFSLISVFKQLESVSITVGEDMPLIMENKHFKIIIAPRTNY